MHILVINDDGPPHAIHSPCVLPFVRLLEAAGHRVSVVLPSAQRSWVGKAFLFNESIITTPYQPPDIAEKEPWYLASTTPAACTHLGLGHLFSDRPKIDFVVSGPNFGGNVSTIHALSSGTLGAAMEAATCGARAIAISFAYKRPIAHEAVHEACRQSVRITQTLAARQDWDAGRCYSVNMPLVMDVVDRSIYWCSISHTLWPDNTSCLHEEETTAAAAPSTRTFTFRPNMPYRNNPHTVCDPYTDVWALNEGYTSVVALTSNFSHVSELVGELTLT